MAGAERESRTVRLDKWLWAARFFKTRSRAIAAIKSGKVDLDQRRVKPSQALREGDTLAVRKGPYTFEVVVTGLSEHRGPATVAATLYHETEAGRDRRERLALERRISSAQGPATRGRPSKKDRRRIIRFTRGNE
jgi:ribosome-associated heat shock protein Hsp15